MAFDEARSLIAAKSPRLPSETIAVELALGRIAGSEATVAVEDFPRFACSAMDGFALAAASSVAASATSPVMLHVAGESRAGASLVIDGSGQACAISTGARIPPLYDAVVARERVERTGDKIVLREPIEAGRNIRRRGEDARAGDVVVRRGQAVTPQVIGALCCYGVRELKVTQRPRLTLLSTGDELVGRSEGDSFVHDANGPMIAALACSMGLQPVRTSVPDCAAALEQAIRDAANSSEVIVSTGGVSVGDHDHLPLVLASMGATVHFHGVAMRPGKPVLFATLADGTLYFGLPGNPVAAAVGFRFFVSCALRAMLGLAFENGDSIQLNVPTQRAATTILKARFDHQFAGEVELADDQRSHTMRPLIACNAWAVLPPLSIGMSACRLFAMTPSLYG